MSRCNTARLLSIDFQHTLSNIGISAHQRRCNEQAGTVSPRWRLCLWDYVQPSTCKRSRARIPVILFFCARPCEDTSCSRTSGWTTKRPEGKEAKRGRECKTTFGAGSLSYTHTSRAAGTPDSTEQCLIILTFSAPLVRIVVVLTAAADDGQSRGRASPFWPRHHTGALFRLPLVSLCVGALVGSMSKATGSSRHKGKGGARAGEKQRNGPSGLMIVRNRRRFRGGESSGNFIFYFLFFSVPHMVQGQTPTPCPFPSLGCRSRSSA